MERSGDSNTALLREHRTRRERLQHFCAPQAPTYNLSTSYHRFFSFSQKPPLVFCMIQKVGSSFWRKAMNVLTGQMNRRTFFTDTFLHSRGVTGYYSFRNKTQQETETLMRSSTKFLFVRDPYSRLFSAYMDKVFFPTHRMFAIGKLYRETLLNTNEADSDQSSEDLTLICDLNVTFETFLKIVTSGEILDPHWTPMKDHCDPCTVGFDYVGKLETFRADTDFILDRVGLNLSILISNETTFDSDNDLSAMKDLAQKAFDIMTTYHTFCPSRTVVCKTFHKIWITLQVRGLLSKNILFPFLDDSCSSINSKDFVRRLVDLYIHQPGGREERIRQREEAMKEAYLRVPRWLLYKVESFVQDDCALFGYNCSVDVRFPEEKITSTKYSYFSKFV